MVCHILLLDEKASTELESKSACSLSFNEIGSSTWLETRTGFLIGACRLCFEGCLTSDLPRSLSYGVGFWALCSLCRLDVELDRELELKRLAARDRDGGWSDAVLD